MTLAGCIVNDKSSSTDINVKSGEVRAPILVLNELDKVNISEVFGDLLDCLEHRGANFTFKLKGKGLSLFVCFYCV